MEVQPLICHVSAADGTRIAYYTMGAGRPLVVLHPFQINGLRLNWAMPLRRRVMRILAEHFTVVHLDFRGAGDSERNITTLTLDGMCDDVISVLDDIGAATASVCAIGTSTMVAARLDATTDRVARLVLLGVGGSLTRQQLFDLQAMNPDIGSDATASAIGGMDDPDDTAGLAEVIRNATTPEVFALYVRLLRVTEHDELLAATSAPTLLVHASDDALLPLADARRIAAQMPNAYLFAVPSKSPLGLWRDEFAVEQIVAFLEGRWSGDPRDAMPRPPARRPAGVAAALTAREREVLALIAKGHTNQQISDTLVISLNTVAHHVKSILTKTGTRNRTQAAALARRLGLIG